MKIEDTILLIVGIGCFLWVLIPELISLYKLFFGKNMTFIKKNGESLTVSRKYNEEDSKKIIEFLKKD